MTNNPHQFDPATRFCTGCGMSEQTLADPPRAKGQAQSTADAAVASCPAHYVRLSDCAGRRVDVAVKPDETLAVAINGSLALCLGGAAMFELRDAIEEGVRKVRGDD